MNYTENYHLPQWVETDRIMMRDFNQMCKDIESGLTENQNTAKADMAALAQKNALNDGKAWAGLLRTGKGILNKRLAQFDRSKLYCENGLLFNPLSSADMAAVLTGSEWHETMGVYAGRGEDVPEDFLRAYCTKKEVGSSSAGGSAIYEFTSPLNGTIQEFTLFLMTHFSSREPKLDLTLNFIAEQRSGSTYTELYRKILHIEREGTALAEENFPVTVNVPLVKDRKYRLTLEVVKSGGVLGRFGFTVAFLDNGAATPVPADESLFRIVRTPITSFSHTRSFSTEGEASHALATVRYRTEEDAPVPVFSLDGAAMTCTEVRTVPYKDGKNCREAWYLLEKEAAGTAKLHIAASCGATDDFRLLEYAVMLL